MFNIEGGCYAKCIRLSAEKEPEIFAAVQFGTVLENVGVDPASRQVDFDDARLTENTRAAYPIEYIPNAKIPCVAGHPRNLILLTCDARRAAAGEQAHDGPGDVPLPQRLHGQGGRHRDGGEGAAGDLLRMLRCGVSRLAAHQVCRDAGRAVAGAQRQAWLVNTGWTGGPYGTGTRIPLPYTRAILDAIHAGTLAVGPTTTEPVFGLAVPTAVPGVPSELLLPRGTWQDAATYDRAAQRLALSSISTSASSRPTPARKPGPPARGSILPSRQESARVGRLGPAVLTFTCRAETARCGRLPCCGSS